MVKENNCNCLYCGKSFYTKPYRLEKRNGGKYCCKECMTLDKAIDLKTVECPVCGREFSYRATLARKYCSKECQLASLPMHNVVVEEKKCKKCGKSFIPKRKQQIYCSSTCSSKSQRHQSLTRCSVCDKLIVIKRSLIKKHNVCSAECLKELHEDLMTGNKYLSGHKHSEETKKKLSVASKNNFKDINYIKKWQKSLHNLPNKLEQYFDVNTPSEVVYTGNGKFFLSFKNGTNKNPDFIVKDKRKVIELFGKYWHREDDPQELIQQYSEIGFECLVFWDYEVYQDTENVLRKVNKFISC